MNITSKLILHNNEVIQSYLNYLPLPVPLPLYVCSCVGCVYLSMMCACACSYIYVCILYVWRSEVNTRHLPPSLFTLYFEAGSHGPRAHQFRRPWKFISTGLHTDITVSSFYMDAEDPNSAPHACTLSSFLMESPL